MRLIGLDPGLQRTGWGVITVSGHRLRAEGCGVVVSDPSASLAERLAALYRGLCLVLTELQPEAAAVEQSFVNRNPASTLKLGHARAISLLAPSLAGIAVYEYAPNAIKRAVVGVGHADKAQVWAMVQRLVPNAVTASLDASDALAVAICHAHHAQSNARVAAAVRVGAPA